MKRTDAGVEMSCELGNSSTANDALDVLRYSVGMGNGGFVGKEIA